MTKEGAHAIKLGFEDEGVRLQVSQIVPLKVIRPGTKDSKKYIQILRSVRAIGLVEAPVVTRDPAHSDQFFLVDGHLRIEALKDIGVEDVECLIATDDDTFTYNKRVNRLVPVQEHKMVVRAVERGVPEAKIAEALGLEIVSVRRRARMLNGICPEAVELLNNAPCPFKVFDILRQLMPLRQIEAAELMIGQGNYTAVFARALLVATPDHQLVPSTKSKSAESAAITEQIKRMEKELVGLQSQIKTVEETYGVDNLQLTLAIGYVSKLLGNARVVRWLAQNRPEYLSEFQAVTEIASIAPAGVGD